MGSDTPALAPEWAGASGRGEVAVQDK